MSEANNQADFSDAFCAFLQSSVASVNAAELLLALAKKPGSTWSAAELAAAVEPVGSVSEAEATAYIETFKSLGLVSRTEEGRVRYERAPEFEEHMQTLARLYVERPVTLFRVIYALRDTKIKTLADAFRIWRT